MLFTLIPVHAILYIMSRLKLLSKRDNKTDCDRLRGLHNMIYLMQLGQARHCVVCIHTYFTLELLRHQQGGMLILNGRLRGLHRGRPLLKSLCQFGHLCGI